MGREGHWEGKGPREHVLCTSGGKACWHAEEHCCAWRSAERLASLLTNCRRVDTARHWRVK